MTEQHPEAVETLLYTFDLPILTESGSIHITDVGIILKFPEIPTTYIKESIKIPQNINVFIENHLRISLAWIPIHTWADYYRVQDMFKKCLESYSYLINNVDFKPHTFLSNPARSYECMTYESVNSSYQKPNEFHLTCFNTFTTHVFSWICPAPPKLMTKTYLCISRYVLVKTLFFVLSEILLMCTLLKMSISLCNLFFTK